MRWDMIIKECVYRKREEVWRPKPGAFLFRCDGRDFGFLFCLRKEALEGFWTEKRHNRIFILKRSLQLLSETLESKDKGWKEGDHLGGQLLQFTKLKRIGQEWSWWRWWEVTWFWIYTKVKSLQAFLISWM